MVIALFEHRLRVDVDIAEWEQTFGCIVARALDAPGFASINTYGAGDGTALAVVRFESDAALEAWRSDPHHVRAQLRGRAAHFESYRMTVASPIVREYAWSRSAPVTTVGERRH